MKLEDKMIKEMQSNLPEQDRNDENNNKNERKGKRNV